MNKNKIKLLIRKHWALIGFLVAYLINEKTKILDLLFTNKIIVEAIKGIGAILLAYYWTGPYNKKIIKINSFKK